MRDYITIGSTPYEEDCAQVGSANYPERSRVECRAFKEQLLRIFGEPPEGADIGVKSFDHDFGTYREVVCYYDEDEEESVRYAFKLEEEIPTQWDNEARVLLDLE